MYEIQINSHLSACVSLFPQQAKKPTYQMPEPPRLKKTPT